MPLVGPQDGCLRHKIKDIPPEGLAVGGPLPPSLLEAAFAGLNVDLGRTAGSYDVTLHQSGDDVLATGRLRATLGLQCDRCLKPARIEADAPINLLYLPPEADEKAEVEEEEAVDYAEHDNHSVDLEGILRELLILSVPMTVRCKEDCRGLCPTCGQDRNEVDCGHGEVRVAATGLASALSAVVAAHKNPKDNPKS